MKKVEGGGIRSETQPPIEKLTDAESTHPPIGQSYGEEVLGLKNGELGERLAIQTERIAGKPVPFEQLCTTKINLENGDGRKFIWNKDNLTRLALLYLDGKSDSEIATVFDTQRPSDEIIDSNLISSVISDTFSKEMTNLGRTASHMRMMNEFLHPEFETEKLLQEIERTFPISRKDIFPLLRVGMGKTRIHTRSTKQLTDADIFIGLINKRVCHNLPTAELVEYASGELGRQVTPGEIDKLFSTKITEKAKRIFEFRETKKIEKLTTDEYKMLAFLYIENPLITRTQLEKIFPESAKYIRVYIKKEGLRLQKIGKHSDTDSPFVTFLLEYGTFPADGGSARAQAQSVERTASDVGAKISINNKKRARQK